MKKTLRFMMIALVAIAMVACEKEEPTPTPTPTPTPDTPTDTELAANTLVYNDTLYHLECFYEVDVDDARSYASGVTIETDELDNPFYFLTSDWNDSTLNRTYDLTLNYPDGDYHISLANPDYTENLMQDLHEGGDGPYGTINDEYYERPIFTSGTMTVTRTETAFVLKGSGVLINGKTLKFHLNIPSSEWIFN